MSFQAWGDERFFGNYAAVAGWGHCIMARRLAVTARNESAGEALWPPEAGLAMHAGVVSPGATVRQDLSTPKLRDLRIAPGRERGGLPGCWFTEQGMAAAGESAAFRVEKGCEMRLLGPK